MLRQGLFYLAGQPKLKDIATGNPMARRLANRFVAGETLDSVISVVRDVNAAGMSATLDLLGENVTTRAEADRASASYVEALQTIARTRVNANISLKLTSLGLDLGRDLAFELASRVIAAAATCNNFVRVDMEGSPYTQVTVDMTRELFAAHPHVGTVIQSYLYRSEDDVRALNADGIRVRLVKGAYLEPPAVAYPEKADVDENYRRLADILLHDGTYPAFATHDESIVGWIKERARLDGIGVERFEFQMLYGIRRDLQEALRREGYNVRVYIPYGTEWYPYLMRRLAERPANVFFLMGNLAREARHG